ncbi:MAG TPA: LacI family DNA-binding transcriptional regulator [Arachnia sp.]|nr:LacI family DNA-binding transcriptional regulator [Arachnia sp.]HMT87237.1 LacI family DNA-binding transcriptional regulator [Arachnia sp.]
MAARRRTATLHEVAERAGVSLKTASNAVNGTGRMSDETRARVERVIEELGYKVNVTARNLILGRTNSVTLAVPTLKSPYLAELAEAVIQVARPHGQEVYVTTYPDDGTHGMLRCLEHFNPHLSDGLLLSMSEHENLTAEQLSVPYPLVCLGSRHTGGAADRVTTNDVADARAAAAHVLSRGSASIAVIGAHHEPDFATLAAAVEGNAEQRLRGILEGCREAGRELDPEAVIVTGYEWTIGAGFRAARRLLDRKVRFDALICLNDGLAIGAISALRESGVRIPEEVQVMGFDNIEEGAYLSPALTSMDSSIGWVAASALGCLAERIESDPGAARTLLSPTRLVTRATTR